MALLSWVLRLFAFAVSLLAPLVLFGLGFSLIPWSEAALALPVVELAERLIAQGNALAVGEINGLVARVHPGISLSLITICAAILWLCVVFPLGFYVMWRGVRHASSLAKRAPEKSTRVGSLGVIFFLLSVFGPLGGLYLTHVQGAAQQAAEQASQASAIAAGEAKVAEAREVVADLEADLEFVRLQEQEARMNIDTWTESDRRAGDVLAAIAAALEEARATQAAAETIAELEAQQLAVETARATNADSVAVFQAYLEAGNGTLLSERLAAARAEAQDAAEALALLRSPAVASDGPAVLDGSSMAQKIWLGLGLFAMALMLVFAPSYRNGVLLVLGVSGVGAALVHWVPAVQNLVM